MKDEMTGLTRDRHDNKILDQNLAKLLADQEGGRPLQLNRRLREDRRRFSKWKRLNLEIAWQMIVYLLIFGVILYGLLSGSYIQFIHPRYKNYLIVALLLLPAMIVAQAPRLWQANLKPRLRTYLWFIFPLFFCFFLWRPEMQGLALVKEGGIAVDDVEAAGQINGQGILVGGFAASQGGTDPAEEVPTVEGAIPIDHLHYAAWLLDLNQNPQKYVGKSYTYLARLDKPLAAGEAAFLPGRPVMLCCAADTQSLGVPAKLNAAVEPLLGSWAYVTGKIYMGRGIDPRFPDEEGAWLDITDVQPAAAPQNSFAYYFGSVEIPE